MAKSICRMLEKYMGVAAGSSEMYYTLAESVLYLLGAERVQRGKKQTGAFAYQRDLKPYCTRVSAKKFRLKLHDYRNISLGIKLLVIWQARQRGLKLDAMYDKAESLGITLTDAQRLFTLFKECDWYRKAVKGHVSTIPRDTEFDSYASVDAFFERIQPEVMRKIKSITYRKLRFLAESNNDTLTEYHSMLLMKVVQVLHRIVPTEKSELYVINYIKQAVHNHAINLIKAGTSQKRARLLETGFDKNNVRKSAVLQVVSLNQMIGTANDPREVSDPDPVDTAAVFESEFCISEILDRFKHTEKRYRLLTILLGAQDAEFTSWLRSKSLVGSGMDNTDLQSSCDPAEYNRLLAEFLRISYRKIERFLASIGGLLASDKKDTIKLSYRKEEETEHD